MPVVASESCAFEMGLPSGPEQRRDPRYVGIDAGVLKLAIRPEFRGRRGLILDVSAGGMGFLLAEPIAAGTTLVFELPLAGSAAAITRLARVCHSRPHPVPLDAPWLPRTRALSSFFRRFFGQQPQAACGDAWLIGCEFDRPLNADELRQLLDPIAAAQ